MVTSVIGKMFLEAYNAKYGTLYNAEQFFLEIFYPLFFDSNKYLYWVQNSSFVQMKSGQKVETLTSDERKEKLNNLEINDPFTKKSIAKVIRRFFEKYVANTSLRQVALAIKPLDNKTGQDLAKLEKRFAEIPSLTANQTISKHHAKILAKLVFNEYKLMMKRIELENIQNHFDGEIRELDKSEKINLIQIV